MATAVSAMADDWEYIDDDAFSIVSLLSDDDATEPSGDSEAVCAVNSLADDLAHPCHRPRSESPTRNNPKPSDTNPEPNSARTVRKCGTNQPDVFKPEAIWCPIRVQEEATNDGGFDALCVRIGPLIKLLGGLLSSPSLRDQSYGVPRHLKATFESLRSQLIWIQDMWHIYERQSRSVLPIGLHEWVESLEVELLKIQGRLICPLAQDLDQADEWYKEIEQLRIKMDGMITVVHNDFVNLRSPLISGSRGDAPIPNRKAHERSSVRIASGSRKNSRTHLRRELCALRDQIVACLGEIYSYEHHGLHDHDQSKKLMTLTNSYKNTKGLLEQLLANQEANWTPSVGRCFTSHEVRHLNPDTISSLVLQLKEVTDALFLARGKIQSRRRRDGHYEELSISESIMDTLCTTDETLVSIFSPSARK